MMEAGYRERRTCDCGTEYVRIFERVQGTRRLYRDSAGKRVWGEKCRACSLAWQRRNMGKRAG